MLNRAFVTDVVLIITFCTVCTGLQWTSASNVTNGSTLHSCEGDTVIFAWSFTTDAAEHLVDVEWYFHQQDPPVVTNGSLTAQLLPTAVWDSSTRQWHAQVACGHFQDAGHPPVNVIWTTPSGSHVPSTHYTGGHFVLTLLNPVTEGDYSCQLEVPSSDRGCVVVNSTALTPAVMKVDAISAQMTILTTKNEKLEQDLMNLQQICSDQNYRPQSCRGVRQYSPANGVHILYPFHNDTSINV